VVAASDVVVEKENQRDVRRPKGEGKMPERHTQLASWRKEVGGEVSEPPLTQPDKARMVREHLASQHRLFRELLLDTVAELDLSYDAVSQYLDQEERSVPHAQWLDERTGYVLGVYERAVAEALRMATRNGLEDRPREREVVRTIYLAPPPQKSWFQQLLWG
jgi:hypothetical protein